jgi:hypothetical protein
MLEQAADLVIISVTLVFQAYRMQQLRDHRCFHPDFKGRLERLGNVTGSESLEAALRGR